MKKHILDIEDIQNEIKKLFNGLFLLERRFYAVALDYKDFISPSWGEQEIFEIRDNVIYRLFSAKLHLELIINQRYFIEKCINDMIAKDPKLFFDSRNINYERYIIRICNFIKIYFDSKRSHFIIFRY